MAIAASEASHMRNRSADVDPDDGDSDTGSVNSSTSDGPSSLFDDTPDTEPEMYEEFDRLRERRVTAWRQHYIVVLCITAGFFVLMNVGHIIGVFLGEMMWLLERQDSFVKFVDSVVGRTWLMMVAVWDIILGSIGMSLFDLKFWKDQHHVVFWMSIFYGLVITFGLSLLLTGAAMASDGLNIWRGMPVPWNGTEAIILMPPAVLLETASFRTPRILGVRLQTRKLPLWKLFRIWYFATIALSIVNIILVVPVLLTGQIALIGHIKEARREFIHSQIQIRREFMFSQIQRRGLTELEEGSGATVRGVNSELGGGRIGL